MTEKDIHLAFCDFIRLHEKRLDLLWLHIANEGKRTPWSGSELKRMGLRPGASDFLFLNPCEDYTYLAIELKLDKKARCSLVQHEFLAHVKRSGGYGSFAYGLDEAIDIFKTFYLS